MRGYGSGTGPPRFGRPHRRRPAGDRRPRGVDGNVERSGPPARKQPCPPELREPFVAARDFLAGLIAALGLPARLRFGGVDAARDGRQLTIDVLGLEEDSGNSRYPERSQADDGLAILIGKHGAMLDALSAVTNAVMHRGESKDLFFAVDVEGYKARRVAVLRSIAARCASKVIHEGVAVELEPMPPAERRIVHLALAGHRDVATESTGAGKDRRVVIMPRGSVLPPADEEDEPFD